MSGGGEAFDENQQWNRIALLVCVTDVNNNKYYRMYDDGNLIRIVRGRVGSSRVYEKPLPSRKWESQYRSKLKTYKDVTHLHATESRKATEFARISDARVDQIVTSLRRYAGASVKENYTARVSQVTQIQVNEAQRILDELSDITDTDSFNRMLLYLFNVIPRAMYHVQDYLWIKEGSTDKILEREQGILDTMAGEVSTEHAQQENEDAASTVLDAMGLKVRAIRDDELPLIKTAMGTDWYRYRSAYAVENVHTAQQHSEWMRQQENDRLEHLWHGSQNGNWWNILTQGLVIRPASTNGSMFGRGLYFANKAAKSIGYTSLNNSNEAYLALFGVHVGRSWSPQDSFGKMDYRTLKEKYDADSVHALAGKCRSRYGSGWLRNDEIIVYREAQASIRFIVTIGG